MDDDVWVSMDQGVIFMDMEAAEISPYEEQ